MLLESLEKLGSQINTVDRTVIEEAFTGYQAKGLSEYDASIAALTEYHKNLLGEVNELRKEAAVPPLRYLPPRLGKAYDYDGLMLGREPTEIEMMLGLKDIAADLETEKQRVIKILQKFRLELIAQAAEMLDGLDAATAHTLTLTPDSKTRKEIAKAIKAAFATGRTQVDRELAAQDAVKSLQFKDERDNEALDFLDELTDGLISKLINAIQTRAVNEYLTLKLLLDYSVEKLKELLLGHSEKFIDQIASSVVNAAIQSGREAEAEAQSDRWNRVIYSAVLDNGTCEPCADADGMEASDPADLPAAPNPDCLGGANCRCFHIYINA